MLSKMIYRFNAITIKTQAGVFWVNMNKLILVFIGKGKWIRRAKTILNKTNESEDSHYLILRLTIIKTVWCWWMDRHKDQRKKTENPKIDPHRYGQLVLDKEASFSLLEKEVTNKQRRNVKMFHALNMYQTLFSMNMNSSQVICR